MSNSHYKPCGRCGNRISIDSVLCPYCRSTDPFPVQTLFFKYIVFPIAGLAAVGLAIQHFFPHHQADAGATAITAPAKAENASDPVPSTPTFNRAEDRSAVVSAEPVPSDGPTHLDYTPLPTPQSSGEIGSAVRRALDSGELSSFSTDTYRGQVSVSTAQSYGDRECRSFRYTISGAGSDQTMDGTACRVGEGSWDLAGKPG